MKWIDFKTMLEKHPGLDLQFKYAENKWVNAAYHITEIKQAAITSVDCGGVLSNWAEIIIQLWEPLEHQQLAPMKVHKALSIISLVENSLSLNTEGQVKIEFGNAGFNTRQMLPAEFSITDSDLMINLQSGTVQCKAMERGGSCGTSASDSECCTPAIPQIELVTLTADNNCCTPGSGCC